MKVKVFDSQTLGVLKEVNLTLAIARENECIVGRSPQSGLVLDSPDVSRMHAKFLLENENYYFCDLGSRNSSTINGKVAQTSEKYLLKAGDVIRIGEFVLIMEELSSQSENIAETVYRSLDATVISNWRESVDLNESVVANKIPEVVNDVSEPVVPISEVTSFQELTVFQGEQEAEIPEVVNDISEPVVPTSEEVSELSEVTSFQELTFFQGEQEAEIPEVVNDVSEITYIQSCDLEEIQPIFEDISPTIEVTKTQPISEDISPIIEATETQPISEEISPIIEAIEIPLVSEKISPIIEATETQPISEEISQVPEILAVSEEAVISEATNAQTMEEVVGTITPVLTEVNKVTEDTLIPVAEKIAISEEINISASNIMNEVPEAIILEASEETKNPSQNNFELVETGSKFSNVIESAEIVGQIDSQIIEVEITEEPEAEIIDTQSPEFIEETPESSTPEIISTKYIVLLAHDSKRWELAEFVRQHQQFFSKYLTLAPPAISELLSQQSSVVISQEISTITSGGYQTIAAKATSGDILAVIFLRDFLQVQSGQANEEAMLRVCNINQVLVATNTPTAEAIVHYIQQP